MPTRGLASCYGRAYQMVKFVVSKLIARFDGHEILATTAPLPAAQALREFNTLANTQFSQSWFDQASSEQQLPFVYAAGPNLILLVTAHRTF